MAIPALIIGTAVVVLCLAAIAGAQGRLRDMNRRRIERFLGDFVDEVDARSHDFAIARHHGVRVEVTLHHHTIAFSATLKPAGVSYEALVERYAGPELKDAIARRRLTFTGDREIDGTVTREAGLGESMASVGQRVALLERIQALRKHAPAELAARIPHVHSAREVDRALEDLKRLFPDAPETAEAYRVAAERYHDARLNARARRFLGPSWVAPTAH